jgi:TRAP transporter 4TM/12TM fusion protein
VGRSDKVAGHYSLSVALSIVAMAMVLYQVAAPFHVYVSPNQHQLVHLTFALVLVFLDWIRRAKVRWASVVLASLYIVLLLFSAVYTYTHVYWLEYYAGNPDLPLITVIIGVILVFLALEATRQTFGSAIPIVVLLFMAYAYWGSSIPGLFHGPPVSLNRLFLRLGIGNMGLNGIFGPILGLSADIIFLFFVYSSLLQVTGGTRFFIQVGRFVGKKLAGGPALTAIVTSALLGMVTGSVSGNITLTGSFTIPLMKKHGYQPHQAGAIEAMASTGGQIMPPVMGLVAFLMAAITGIPYIQICLMAAIPAALYFLSGGLYAQFQALKSRTRILEEQKIDFREMFLFGPLFVLPLLLLVVLLIIGFSLNYIIVVTTAFLVALSLIRKETRPSLKQLIDGITKGALSGAAVAASCAALGIILGCISFTVFISKIPMIIMSISGGHLIAVLLLAAASAIILGMGASTSVAYLLVVLVSAPVLMRLGVTTAQAHLFVLYYAVLGFLTPPVAVGSLIASRLAGAPFLKTGMEATKVALGGFIIPFLFIYCPVLVLQPVHGDLPLNVLKVAAAFVLVIVAQIVVCGQYFVTTGFLERCIFGVITLVLFVSLTIHNFSVIIGSIAGFILMSILQWNKKRGERR